MVEIAIGIDVGELSGKRLDLVALDRNRRIVRTVRGANLEDVVRIVLTELHPQVVCIDSPPGWAPSGARRACERALTRVGINLFTTPSEDRAVAFHRWMRDGVSIYEGISSAYPRYCGGAVLHTAVEYFPHASAVALAGVIGPRREKSRFRREVLEANGVDTSGLAGMDQVDAALGALTGLIALEGRHCWTGGADGAILLPVARLPERFPRRAAEGVLSAEGAVFPRQAAEGAVSPRQAAEGAVSPRTAAEGAVTAEGAVSPPETVRKRRVRQMNPCECGCGAPGPGRFRPGHDAKLLSRLEKEARLALNLDS